EAQIVLLGLAGAAGKTAILHWLKLSHVVNTGPTIGFNAETLEYNGISFGVWDVGGQVKLRGLLRHYLYGAQGVIFVVDSSDREWILQAQDQLNMILNEEEFKVRDPALLVFATKQDRPNAMSAAEVAGKFGLQSLLCNRIWHIQSCCAISGEGLHEGMDWLCTNIQ
ncbi:unnamed protein product, partial [Miscanthus lutarioriparius]